jgi:hypothetical protein
VHEGEDVVPDGLPMVANHRTVHHQEDLHPALPAQATYFTRSLFMGVPEIGQYIKNTRGQYSYISSASWKER